MEPRSADEQTRDRFAEMTRIAARSQRFGTVLVVVVALIVAVGSSVVSVWNTMALRTLTEDTRRLLHNDLTREIDVVLEKREREFGSPSVRCLLEQLSEHRHLNALAHRAEAAEHGFSYPVPPDEEPPPVSDADTVCARFFDEGAP